MKDRRPSISPNFNFLGQLLEYERSLKLLAATTDPALKGQLTGDLKAEEGRLRALEARAAAQ